MNKKFRIIEDTGIIDGGRNGARTRTIMFKRATDESQRYRIKVWSETYASQSYARLEKWTDEKGWAVISAKNPKRDYGIDLSYSKGYSQSAFDRIVDDLFKIAESF